MDDHHHPRIHHNTSKKAKKTSKKKSRVAKAATIAALALFATGLALSKRQNRNTVEQRMASSSASSSARYACAEESGNLLLFGQEVDPQALNSGIDRMVDTADNYSHKGTKPYVSVPLQRIEEVGTAQLHKYKEEQAVENLGPMRVSGTITRIKRDPSDSKRCTLFIDTNMVRSQVDATTAGSSRKGTIQHDNTSSIERVLAANAS